MSELRRPAPNPQPGEEPYWEGGTEGELRILRCRACRTYVHPPVPMCPACRGRSLDFEAVSGVGRVYSYAINHQAWDARMPPPYVIASVELDEQPGLRLITSVTGCATDDVTAGMRVHVHFEESGRWQIPLFAPIP